MQVPGPILDSEPPVGQVQRHWLRERSRDDCPRCGWHGYFHHYIATVGGDWAAAVCDDCYADLHPGISVTVKFYAARLPCSWPHAGEVVAVIRQRDRSDHNYPGIGRFPDTGQQLTWRLWWAHTTMLIEEARASCDYDLAEISHEKAGQLAAEIAAPHWPPGRGPAALDHLGLPRLRPRRGSPRGLGRVSDWTRLTWVILRGG